MTHPDCAAEKEKYDAQSDERVGKESKKAEYGTEEKCSIEHCATSHEVGTYARWDMSDVVME